MNNDILKGKLLQLRGEMKKTWGNLTDDDLQKFTGEVDKLAGIIQERYGITREQAEKQAKEFMARFK
ncbi:MAG: CsbD family protein [Anaerolineales bacterium]|jgi:uncharacterized protein YjbJ (UPF0337 family)